MRGDRRGCQCCFVSGVNPEHEALGRKLEAKLITQREFDVELRSIGRALRAAANRSKAPIHEGAAI